MNPSKESGPRGLLGRSSDSRAKPEKVTGAISLPCGRHGTGGAADGKEGDALEFPIAEEDAGGDIQHRQRASGAGRTPLPRVLRDERRPATPPLCASVSPSVNRETATYIKGHVRVQWDSVREEPRRS